MIIQNRNGTILFLLHCDMAQFKGYWVHLCMWYIFFTEHKKYSLFLRPVYMAQQVKPLPTTPACYRVSIQVLSAPLLPAEVPGKARESDPWAWTSATPMLDSDGVPGSSMSWLSKVRLSPLAPPWQNRESLIFWTCSVPPWARARLYS